MLSLKGNLGEKSSKDKANSNTKATPSPCKKINIRILWTWNPSREFSRNYPMS